VQTRFGPNKVLDQASLVDGMIVPDQDNRTCNAPQDLFEEKDHMLTTQIHSKGFHRQFHFSSSRTDQESAQQVEPLVMSQAGIHLGRLATGSPTAAKGRNQ